MPDQRYWFPVRPAARGWGWGLPQVWQGWAVLAGFCVLLVGGLFALAPYGQLACVMFGCVMGGALIAIAAWKGEPQSLRHRDLPNQDKK